jgi:hypothetical protein
MVIAGCQRFPAVPPTAAEVVEIQITIGPQLTPSPEASSGQAVTPDAAAYPSLGGYPAPTVALSPGAYPSIATVDPYFAPGGEGYPTFEPFPFKTSQPDLATVRGSIIVPDPLVLSPSPEDGVYLVPLAGEEQGPFTIPGIVKGETPQAEVDERTGDFVFTNIQPGRYAVVIVTVGGTEVPAVYFDSSNIVVVTITPSDMGKIIDLGHLSL